MKLTVIGTGHLASALAKLHRDYYAENTIALRIVTHSSSKEGAFLYGTLIEKFAESILEESELILLAIPAEQTLSWAAKYRDCLAGKTLIDCSNKIGNGKALQQLLQDNDCAVIKAFTALAVFHITDSKFSITESAKEVLIAGNSPQALSLVSDLVQRFGFIARQIPHINASEAMEAANFAHFSKWRSPLVTSLATWLFFGAYAVLERNIAQGQPWYEQGLQNMNAAFACNALTQFGLVYSAGAIAQIRQDVGGRALGETDKRLIDMLNRRKQLGLTAMYNLGAHVSISLLLFGSSYYAYFSEEAGESTRLTSAATISLMCGVLAYAFYSLISLTSLPSIAKELGMTEWKTVQSYLGWSALTLATAHVLAMSFQSLLSDTEWNQKIPSLFLLAVLAPGFALITKMTSMVTSGLRKCASTYKNSVHIEEVKEESSQPSITYTRSEAYARYGTFGGLKETLNGSVNNEVLKTPSFP